MPRYELNRLGSGEFEQLVQSLLKKIIGDGTITFGAGADGAREATYKGSAPYPSLTEHWSGTWLFQVKYHDTELSGTDKARKAVIADLQQELDKVVNKYKYEIDNFVFATNVPLSPKASTGTLDQLFAIARDVAPQIKNIAIWGADEINRFLDKYTDVRTTYLHLIVPGDLIAALMGQADQRKSELHLTLQSYLDVMYGRELYAQLDQAGDVAEKPVKLPTIFLELHADPNVQLVANAEQRESATKVLRFSRDWGVQSAVGDTKRLPITKLFLIEDALRVVLVGGPGEGKSTVGQYLAQLHRAQLLGRVEEVAISDDYVPVTPRIPLRVILREFGQWLSEGRKGAGVRATLEDYICDQIRQATGRALTPDELHALTRENPTLLILDGLDEVSDPSLKNEVIERSNEFIRRIGSLMTSNLQVLATTRPTGYSDQFDPRFFVHLDLLELEPQQIRDYVARWTEARELDAGKGGKLARGIEECLADAQVRLLMKTPLQVTILVLIISAGGTPPRQREALFNEYLEVIYKREQGKGSEILTSNKELLIGLHKYIGYELQERATHARATDATLFREGYVDLVSKFLKWHDPYSDEARIDKQLKQITVEAGERLVLLVESSAGRFGFELRSLQEFFAACHMVDTACSTTQRYARFEAIARLPHWRNVSLFFAGRVGRNFSGEASNIIEACRTIDREGVDVHLRRGSALALNIASDRALLPNRRHQHSLLEIALDVLDSEYLAGSVHALTEVIRTMPEDDVADHVVPILEKKLTVLAPERLKQAVAVMANVMPSNAMLPLAVGRMIESPQVQEEGFIEALNCGTHHAKAVALVSTAVSRLTTQQASELFTRASSFAQVERWMAVLIAAKVPDVVTHELIRRSTATIYRYVDFPFRRTRAQRGKRPQWPDSGAQLLLRVSEVVLVGQQMSARKGWAQGDALQDFIDEVRQNAPVAVIAGRVSEFARAAGVGPGHPMIAAFWALHLLAGNVTSDTLQRALRFFDRVRSDPFTSDILRDTAEASPILLRIREALLSGADLMQLAPNLSYWAGARGLGRWGAFATALKSSTSVRSQPASLTTLKVVETAAPRYEQRTGDKRFLTAVPDDVSYLIYALEEVPPQRMSKAMTSILGDWNAQLDYALALPFMTSRRQGIIGGLLRQPDSASWPARAIRTAVVKRLVEYRGSSDSSLLIQALLAAADVGPVSERLIRKVLHEASEDDADIFYYVTSHMSSLNELFAFLMGVATSKRAKHDARTGACRVLRAAAFRPLFLGRDYSKAPRYAGFIAQHRLLASMLDRESRMAAISLYGMRENWTPKDMALIRTLFVRADSDQEARLLQGLLENGLADQRRIRFWCGVLTDLLEEDLRHDVAAFVRRGLEQVLALADQSLSASQEDLDLPLAPHN